jgi:hypothetical protein
MTDRKPLWECPYCDEKRYTVSGARAGRSHIEHEHPEVTGTYEKAISRHLRRDSSFC